MARDQIDFDVQACSSMHTLKMLPYFGLEVRLEVVRGQRGLAELRMTPDLPLHSLIIESNRSPQRAHRPPAE